MLLWWPFFIDMVAIANATYFGLSLILHIVAFLALTVLAYRGTLLCPENMFQLIGGLPSLCWAPAQFTCRGFIETDLCNWPEIFMAHIYSARNAQGRFRIFDGDVMRLHDRGMFMPISRFFLWIEIEMRLPNACFEEKEKFFCLKHCTVPSADLHTWDVLSHFSIRRPLASESDWGYSIDRRYLIL